MRHILLYWNHICVLHRQEKTFLDALAQRLLSDEIQLEVRYFGLGYPEHMSEYLARPDAILPDLIVSADLEVFEDTDIFCKLNHSLYPVRSWIPAAVRPDVRCRRTRIISASVPVHPSGLLYQRT